MPLLLLFLLISVLLYLWLSRRNSTLTRTCRWRLDRTVSPTHFKCAACGAEYDAPPGKSPNLCLRNRD